MTRTTAARIALPLYLGAIYASLGVARVVTEYLRSAGVLRLCVAVAFSGVGAAVIFLLARDPQSRSPRVMGVVAGMACLYAAAILPMQSPEEKLHFIEYGGVALLAWTAMPVRLTAWRRFLAAALFTLAAGWTDEGIQALLPSRHYDLRDVGFNLAAGVLALTALSLVRWARRPSLSFVSER